MSQTKNLPAAGALTGSEIMEIEQGGAKKKLLLTALPGGGGGGTPGADGESAYQIAVDNGFVGSEAAWLLSLVGSPGADGADGAVGAVGPTGATGAAGAVGATGATGPSGATGAIGPAGVVTPASVTDINSGTDNTNAVTSLGLQGSKYTSQDGAKNYAVASGTNTFTATISPAIASYTAGLFVRLKMTNANTGASTINLNSLGAKNIYSGPSTSIGAGAISAGQIVELTYDGTNFQMAVAQVVPTTPNKVITTNPAGALQAANDLIDINSTTTEATLIAATWTGGVASATGTPGTWVLGTSSNYLYVCTGTNTWVRIPCYLDYIDIYLGSVSDSGGTKTSIQMAALYPSAIRGQYAVGTAGVYQYFGLLGWYYFENKI